MVTIGVTFALVCWSAGLSGVETQLLSAFLYAGTAQFALADLTGKESGATAIAATGLSLSSSPHPLRVVRQPSAARVADPAAADRGLPAHR